MEVHAVISRKGDVGVGLADGGIVQEATRQRASCSLEANLEKRAGLPLVHSVAPMKTRPLSRSAAEQGWSAGWLPPPTSESERAETPSAWSIPSIARPRTAYSSVNASSRSRESIAMATAATAPPLDLFRKR